MLSVMLFLASRDPARNVAIIDAFTAGLCVLAVTPLISFYMLDIQKIFPGHLVWGGLPYNLGSRQSTFTCGHGRRIGNPRGIFEQRGGLGTRSLRARVPDLS